MGGYEPIFIFLLFTFYPIKDGWKSASCKYSSCQKSDPVIELIVAVTINNTSTVDVAIVAPVFVVVIIFFVVIVAWLLIGLVIIVSVCVVAVAISVDFVGHKFTIEHN